jgi:hypothetical protein
VATRRGSRAESREQLAVDRAELCPCCTIYLHMTSPLYSLNPTILSFAGMTSVELCQKTRVLIAESHALRVAAVRLKRRIVAGRSDDACQSVSAGNRLVMPLVIARPVTITIAASASRVS